MSFKIDLTALFKAFAPKEETSAMGGDLVGSCAEQAAAFRRQDTKSKEARNTGIANIHAIATRMQVNPESLGLCQKTADLPEVKIDPQLLASIQQAIRAGSKV